MVRWASNSCSNDAGHATSSAEAPPSRADRAACATACRIAGCSCSARDVSVQPTLGGGPSGPCAACSAQSDCSASTEGSSATSSTEVANRPTSSSVSEISLTPERGTRRAEGLYPTTPQNEAGRLTEPAVWVPSASGASPAATAAADPLDDPP